MEGWKEWKRALPIFHSFVSLRACIELAEVTGSSNHKECQEVSETCRNTIMIENEFQLKISERWLKMLREELEKMTQEYTAPQEFAVFAQGVMEHIEQIEIQIKEYLETRELSPTISHLQSTARR